ncbi:MAG TPA: sulfite oxidase [Pirellulales bacterium]|nr:sulfite oxidase [Pirellulales bacterium]
MAKRLASKQPEQLQVSRRRFLQAAGAGAAAGSALGVQPFLGRSVCSWAVEATPDSAQVIAGKKAGLIVHNTKEAEIETPLAMLREHTITPKELLFVRSNQEVPGTRTTKPADAEGWTIEIGGLVETPAKISIDDLRKFESAEVEMVLQCSGNGRALFSKASKVAGAPWTQGAMGNVQFAGPRLKDVFDSLNLNISPAAAFLTAEGKDGPAKPGAADFEHSMPLADAMSRGILALEMNGEPIPAVHGGPVRLAMPGYYGTMSMKWLTRLRLEDRETFNHHQRRRYRTPLAPIKPGSPFEYDFSTSEANWRMKIKSVVFAPLDGETLKAGKTTVRGVAFNDGSVKIDAVVLSLDDGLTWRQAKLERPKSPYAWHPWTAELELKRGTHRILASAIDALGRTQPLDGAIGWNPAGYCWNGVQRVQINVT